MLDISPEKLILKPAFAKIVCEPGWRWARREKPMPNFDLFYVWSGEGDVEVNGVPTSRDYSLNLQGSMIKNRKAQRPAFK